jgi:hypothetical protein
VRSGKGGSGVSPDYDTAQYAHAHNKPSAVEKGNSSDCNATQHAHATKRKKNGENESDFKQLQKALF